ncbi:CotD family spore coat protein [Camelliibacillus cellulosilyticus]|uniref:CotD family spore coat protein n=1 Tax=Camelliibacillus cellulosilyticus TaxID=2174486 RepID=A0ABV9GPC0_9BACL
MLSSRERHDNVNPIAGAHANVNMGNVAGTHANVNMANVNPSALAPANNMYPVSPMHVGPTPNVMPAGPCGIECPPRESTRTMPAMYDPVRQSRQPYIDNVVVPVIHPSHTTHWIHTNVTHAHYFPHTESVQHTESCRDVMCGAPCPPCPCPPGAGPVPY